LNERHVKVLPAGASPHDGCAPADSTDEAARAGH
jgi:hypothetical protein